MTFGEKLKQLRIKNEYSQEQLAEMLNVSRQAITKWETEKGMPDIENLKAIADLFDVTLDSLVREEEELETTEESLCWNAACVCGVIGLILGFLFNDFSVKANMAAWGIGSGAIGYAAAYLVRLFKQKR